MPRLDGSSRGPVALAFALTMAQVVAGCTGSATETPDETQEASSLRLELVVQPVTGDAPLEVDLRAVLSGDPVALTTEGDGSESLECPSLAWVMGNGDVLITRPEECPEGQVPTDFELTYTYEAAGAYDAVVRLLASDLPPSNPVQVLVGGATPSPAPVAAVPGPTIVLATPDRATAEATIAASRTARATTPAPTATTQIAGAAPTQVAAPATETAAAPAPTHLAGPATPAPSERVLPADLYFLSGAPARLWLLPSTGGAPIPITPTDEPVEGYAVSPAGVAAYLTGGALKLVVADSEPLVVEPDSASRPVWSRDGRRLAYEADGVWLYDMVGGRRRPLVEAGAPEAWSRDGKWLLTGLPDQPEVVDSESGRRRSLPVDSADSGGWLNDRDVVWLATPGLRLITVRDTLMLTTLLEKGRVDMIYVRPDLQLLAWVESDEGVVPNVVDLAAPVLTSRPFGPPLRLPDETSFSWAPDGRHGALAGPDGLVLLDAASGAEVPLLELPAACPHWILAAK